MAIFSSSAPDQQDAMLAQWQGRQFKSELAAVLCRYSTHPLVAAAIAAGRLDPNAPVPAEATGLIDTLEGRRPVSDMTVRQLLAIGAQALAQGAVADAEHVVAVELLEENAHAGSSVGTLAALKLCTTRDGQQVVAMMGDPSDPWWGYLLARITCVLDDPLDSPLTEQILASPPAAGACLFHPAVDPLAMLPHVQTPELGDMLLLRALATDDPALRAELALSCLGHASPRMATWALQALTGGARPQA
jgi:hypothetical protein